MKDSSHLDSVWKVCLLVLCIVAMVASGCGGDDDSSGAGPLFITKQADTPAAVPAGEAVPEGVSIQVTDARGAPRSGVAVEFQVELGGGSVVPSMVTTDENGRAVAQWTVGISPVRNRLAASISDASVFFQTRAALAEPLAPSRFGDVDGFLTDEGIEGSTEDLAFDGTDRMILGVGMPGGLIEVDPVGSVASLDLTGDPLEGPLGVAFDQDGELWVADSMGSALRRVSPDGVVTTALMDDGEQPFGAPNYVAVDRQGRVYLSDPCLGELIRYDPVSASVDAVLTFDLPTQGGPNGFAFDASGERLYVLTENTVLFCLTEGVELTAELGGLFVVDVSDDGFGDIEPIATNVGLFGDGVAFDAEGNLYAIFDTQMNLRLAESAVWVLPAGETQLVKFLSASDRVFANLAFGQGDFDARTMYIALLAVPPFQLPERGVERIEIGIPGLPVPIS